MNKFFNFLWGNVNENFSYKVDKDFEEQTGIRGKRFQTILKSGGADASYKETQILLQYFSQKLQRTITPDELFGVIEAENEMLADETEKIKPKPPTLKPKTGKAKDLDNIMDKF
jgi:hypothetical protein